MAIMIGHASIDERGRITGGIAGDQSGKEVCIRSYYVGSFKLVLRCKDPKKAELMAKACEDACNNNYIGYDQSQRNTLRTQAKANGWNLARITTPCETDCSALMSVCAECAGINIPYSGSNAPTTSTMQTAFVATGMFDVLIDKKYLTSSKYLKRGDILVKPGSHTVMMLGDGSGANSNKTVQNSDKTVQNTQKAEYIIGKTYKLNTNLYIREQPFGEKMKFSCITQNAQQHSKFDDYGCAILQEGTEVTCKSISKQTNSTWMLIPSGWICAIEAGKVYIN